MKPGEDKDRRASLIAAIVTFVAAFVIIVLMFVFKLGGSREMMAEASIPETLPLEELFLEPELLVVDNAGEEDGIDKEAPAPQPEGVPEQAEVDQPVRKIKNETPPKEPPVKNVPPKVTTENQNDVTAPTPKLSEKDSLLLAKIPNKTTGNNGAIGGVNAPAVGVGGTGLNAKGSLNGRTMIECNTVAVKVSQTTTVKVRVEVDAAGDVKNAEIEMGSTKEVNNKCRQMALKSKWTPSEGAKPVWGVITFTISPK